jgi:biotin transport system substrate-specific component
LRIASVLFLTALTAAAAQMSLHLPFTPVPLSLQPTTVLIGAAALGPRLAAASQALYLLLGALGVPVFAASAILPPGAARLLGPTGGYLLAYPAAAFVTGWLAERGFDRRYLTSVLAMCAGLSVVLASGTVWLAYVSAGPVGPAMGLAVALETGLYPFVLQDLVKVCVAGAILPVAWKVLDR